MNYNMMVLEICYNDFIAYNVHGCHSFISQLMYMIYWG